MIKVAPNSNFVGRFSEINLHSKIKGSLSLELLKRSHISLVSRAQAQTLAPGGFARFWSSCPKERATAPPVSDRVGRQSRRHQF